ncbi:MAG: hypothetical protein EXS13_15120 [Planctomycetes bacterium]|nr:hypothetical protein [Planctomycetota bacterium]
MLHLAARLSLPLVLAALATESQLVLKGFDPIELIDGREVEGHAKLDVEHGAFRYRFVSEDNRDLFLAEPEQWGVQWDGACGRMGPLSGTGSPDRFAVWDSRIWVFASDPCRAGFLKAPEKLQPIDQDPPGADDAAKAAGQALLEKAAAACGDVAALDALKSVHVRSELKTTSGGAEFLGTRDLWFAFPGSYRFEAAWDGKGYGHALAAGVATRFEPGETQPLGTVSTTAVEREALRHPLWILRERENLLAVPAGTDTVLGRPVELVTVHAARQNVTLALDVRSGHILELRHTGLTPRGIAPVVRRITRWKPAGKLTLPVRIQAVGVDGLADDNVSGEPTIEVDGVVADGHFCGGVKKG